MRKIKNSRTYLLEKVADYIEQGESERNACASTVIHFLKEMEIEVTKEKEKSFINELLTEWRTHNDRQMLGD